MKAKLPAPNPNKQTDRLRKIYICTAHHKMLLHINLSNFIGKRVSGKTTMVEWDLVYAIAIIINRFSFVQFYLRIVFASYSIFLDTKLGKNRS